MWKQKQLLLQITQVAEITSGKNECICKDKYYSFQASCWGCKLLTLKKQCSFNVQEIIILRKAGNLSVSIYEKMTFLGAYQQICLQSHFLLKDYVKEKSPF